MAEAIHACFKALLSLEHVHVLDAIFVVACHHTDSHSEHWAVSKLALDVAL